MNIKLVKLDEAAKLPNYARPGDAGLDIYAIENLTIKPGEHKLVRTGFAIELPEGTEAQIRSRSGLALKRGISVLNSPGTVDSGYRGEIGVILINHGKEDFEIKPGSKIAQMVIVNFIRANIEAVESLSGSNRGEEGFGSTGNS